MILDMDTDVNEHKKIEKTQENTEIACRKEIHHRIKNNLQVIYSLLDLQAERFKNRKFIEDSEILEAIRESQNRILSMSLIHEELYTGEGKGTLNFSAYLKRLANSLFQTYRLGSTSINLNTDLEEDIFFDINTAVPLGMIVNEFVSNSFKYAFLGRDKGMIQIKLFSEEAGNEQKRKNKTTKKGTRYTLIVSDDGAGIPEKVDIENPETLGLQLVNLLVDQLDGEIELKRDEGTEFTIWFSDAGKWSL